jgi:hypothetical protein
MYILKVQGLGYSYADFFKFINSLDPAAWFITIVVGWVVKKLTSDLTNSINHNNKQIRIYKKSQGMQLKEFQDSITKVLKSEISGVKKELSEVKTRLDKIESNQDNILDILTKPDNPDNIEPS